MLETLLASELNTRISFLNSCQQFIEALYASGKLPGSCSEIVVGTSSVFLDDLDGNKKVRLDATVYDGALKFRTLNGGYAVCDLAMLYKEPAAGYDKFIDLGYYDIPIDAGDVDPATGITVNHYREYRVPASLISCTDTIYAWMKKRPPVLDDNSEVPVRSLHAVKLGLLAVGLEGESDAKAAETFWQLCYRELASDHKEYDGVKRRVITFRDSAARTPMNRP